jgi:hypothetical protein
VVVALGHGSILVIVSLPDELERIAARAAAHGEGDAEVAAVLAAEPSPGERVYLCALHSADGHRTWLALDRAGEPVRSRRVVRAAASIAGLCELAEETAGGGGLDELHAKLVAVRLTEAPPGIEDAEEAVLALQRQLGVPPHVASPARLDAIGRAALQLERALGQIGGSPFTAAMKAATNTLDTLVAEIEGTYGLALEQ